MPRCGVEGELVPPSVVGLADPVGQVRGSGVVIANDWVLTAKHVTGVETADGFPIVNRFDHPDLDLALLRVPGVRGHVRFGAMPKEGDELHAFGYHLGRVRMRTDGYQSNVLGWMSAPIIFGCSGGACVNEHGELIGILVKIGMVHTPMGDSYGVGHVAGYTPLTPDVLGWIDFLMTP